MGPMGSTALVEILRTWTETRHAELREDGITLSLVLPADPSATAVAVLFAERQPPGPARGPGGDVMGQLAVAADGLCVVELLDLETGETLYKCAVHSSGEAQLLTCLADFEERLRSR